MEFYKKSLLPILAILIILEVAAVGFLVLKKENCSDNQWNTSSIFKKNAYTLFREHFNNLAEDSTAQEIADVLMLTRDIQPHQEDQKNFGEIEAKLIGQLRQKVKAEVSELHEKALKSSSYREGYRLSRNSGVVLALYPMSEDPSVMEEAEELSLRQTELIRRLELIRRQRYNYWAAQQLEKALNVLRQYQNKEGMEFAVKYLRVIEPKFLEPAVSSVYSYTTNEMMKEFNGADKAKIAKMLTDTSTFRRGLEGF